MYIEEFIDLSNRSESIEELIELFSLAVKPLGIERVGSTSFAGVKQPLEYLIKDIAIHSPLCNMHKLLIKLGLDCGTDELELGKNAMHHLDLLVRQFYRVYLSLTCESVNSDINQLSQREQEVLRWCACGKTRQEIGEILEISPNTVDFHLRNIFRKLGTNNITVAVLSALNIGMIQL